MADDWKPGDLAAYVGHKPDCPSCWDNEDDGKDPGVLFVTDVVDIGWLEVCGLRFVGHTGEPFCSCGFKQVPPHTEDAFDREVITHMAGHEVENA